MDKLVTINEQVELQTNSRLEKILGERRATLAKKKQYQNDAQTDAPA
ncbi:MAG: hypothetical protein KAZ98_03240 [Prevotella sp.]|nr:hypothetical protein [Prevotella sp.]